MIDNTFVSKIMDHGSIINYMKKVSLNMLKNIRYKKTILVVLAIFFFAMLTFDSRYKKPHIAKITIDNIITQDSFRYEKLEELSKNKNTKAVIALINSPGGTVVGGEILYKSIKNIAQQKPIVSVMGEVATSAAYMASLGSNYIFAQKGTIKSYITRSNRNRQLMEVSYTKGKSAVTNYKTLEIFQNNKIPTLSLVECKLDTGRTHQIRVHMSYKGNSIIGDKLYQKKNKKFKKIDMELNLMIKNIDRQFLHAKSLGFVHPLSNKKVHFEIPLPKDLLKLVKKLRNLSK